MRRLPPLALCICFALAGLPAVVWCAQPDASAQAGPATPAVRPAKAKAPASKAAPAAKAPARSTAKAKAKAKHAENAAAISKAKALQPDPTALSQGDLLSPYSALVRSGSTGAKAATGQNATRLTEQGVQSNATSWKQDLKALAPGDDDAVQFRLGKENVVDPLTGKELTPRADPLGAQRRLREMDLKGAVDKLGGKAEVQVDILKF